MAQWFTNPTRNHGLRVRSLALLSRLRIRHCHELWCRSKTWLNLALLWLWHRLAATAPIRPLAWDPPYAMGAALEKAKRLKTKIYIYIYIFFFFWVLASPIKKIYINYSCFQVHCLSRMPGRACHCSLDAHPIPYSIKRLIPFPCNTCKHNRTIGLFFLSCFWHLEISVLEKACYCPPIYISLYILWFKIKVHGRTLQEMRLER